MGTDLSNTDLPAFKRKPGWDGAIGTAKGLHQEYVNALDEWGQFQKKHGDKVRLWQTTRTILKKSITADGISISHLCDALDLSMTYENAEDEDDEKWVFEEWLYASLNLGFDASLADLAGKAGTVNDDFSSDNEFISFGRKLVTRRAAVELAANRLIHYMKYGEQKDQPPLQLHGTGIAEKQYPKHDASNEFYTDFMKYDLNDQIIIAKELTYGLGNSQRGKDFLANLFEFQHLAIFDPFGFTQVRSFKKSEQAFYRGGEAIMKAKAEYITVFTKDPEAYSNKYLTSEGKYKQEKDPDIQTDSVTEHLIQLLTQLYAGLIHFHATRTNDTHYMDDVAAGRTAPNGGSETDNPDPEAVVSKFTGEVLSLFVNDDQMRSIIDNTDWSEKQYDKPDWSKDYLDRNNDVGWTTDETKKVAAASVGKADSFVDELNLGSARWLGPHKILFATMGATAGMASLFEPGSKSAEQQIKDLRAIGKGVTDLSALERYLPEEFADEIADINRGAKLVNMGRKAAKFLGTIGTVLDGLGVILNAYDMACQMSRGDYDAAGGYALLGLSGVAGLGATAAGLAATSASGIGYATAATLGLISGGLVVISLLLAALGTAVVAWCDESEITEWIRNTRFGKGWSDLNERNILDPSQQTFGYKQLTPGSDGPLGGPDYSQQISSLHSLVRPIGLSDVSVGTATPQGGSGDHPFGELTIKPFENGVWSSKSDVEILEEGFLFVRPLPILEESNQPPEYSVTEDVNTEYLHRISLQDEPSTSDPESKVSTGTDTDWKTTLAEHDPNPYYELIEQFRETDFDSSDLDLEITDVAKETNENGEGTVIRWSGTFWDKGSDGTRIFGWPPDELSSDSPSGQIDEWRYVEILYAPPELADSIRKSKVEMRPKDIPAVSRGRARIVPKSGGPSQ